MLKISKACLVLCVLIVSLNRVSYGLAAPDSTLTYQQFIKKDSVLSLRSRQGYIPSLIHNFWEQLVSPLHMKPRQWLAFGAVAAATAVLFRFDHEIDESFRTVKSTSEMARITSPHISELGNNYGYGLVAGFGIAGLLSKNEKLFETALLASQAMITSGVWVRLVKYSTSRERPSASYSFRGHEGGYWYGFFKEFDPVISEMRDVSYFDAFPSGHTSTAFAIATVFALQYSDRKALPVMCYTVASLVGISRMTEHTHWASDVLVGGFAGYLCAIQVVNHHRKVQNKMNHISRAGRMKPRVLISPSNQFAGLNLRMVF